MRHGLIGIVLGAAAIAAERQPQYDQIWKDPEIEQRIENGIRANRMGWATLRFEDAQGKPLSNVEFDLRQTRHDFYFGANIFMLNGFDTPEKNRKYQDAFLKLFNFATVPFYWSDLEPEPGKVRFAKDSVPIARRPPPDAVVEFCNQNRLTMRGHNLLWHSWYPSWLPKDQEEVTRATRRRIEQIAARYKDMLPFWDVVNEPMERPGAVIMPSDFLFWSHREAERLFPPAVKLSLNEVTSHWNTRGELTPFNLLLQNMFLRGAKVDVIGLQFHVFSEKLWEDVLAGKAMTPAELYRALDLYARYDRPIHVTEITIPTLPNTPAGERDQAIITRNLYRLWFSHPSVEAIIWWNLPDGTAAKGENKWGGGLLREDFTPKPSWNALERLIREEWVTSARRSTGPESTARVQGFHGEYELSARQQGQTVTRRIRIAKSSPNEIVVRFGAAQ